MLVMPKYVPVIHLFSEIQISISRILKHLRDKHRILSLQKARDVIIIFSIWKEKEKENKVRKSFNVGIVNCFKRHGCVKCDKNGRIL